MDLEIDISSPEPMYQQIVRQIQHGAQDGQLAAGAALPSIRQLAYDLDLNENTVARAYRILESNRVIRTAGRKGTFVHSDASSHIRTRNGEDAIHQLSDLVTSLVRKGLLKKQIEAAFRTAIDTVLATGST
jgi:GntR family transcriptional regulator